MASHKAASTDKSKFSNLEKRFYFNRGLQTLLKVRGIDRDSVNTAVLSDKFKACVMIDVTKNMTAPEIARIISLVAEKNNIQISKLDV